MKNISHLLLWLVFLSLGNTAAAQDFRPATITRLSGSTERGSIRYGYWGIGNTPQAVKFLNAGGETQTLEVKDLTAFEVTRKDGKTEKYVRKEAWINRSPDELRDLEFSPTLKMVRDTVFMLSILESQALQFLSYGEGKRQLHFLQMDTLTALVFKRYLVNDGGADKMRVYARYQSQLLSLMADRPDLRAQILQLPYKEKSILALLESYLSSKQFPVEYKYAREKTKPTKYILGGLTAASIDFSSVPSFTHKLQRLNPSHRSIMPSLGAGFAYPVPRTNGKFNLVAELGARAYQWKKTERVDITSQAYDINSYKLRFAHARLTTLFKWKVTNSKNTVSLSLGMTNGLLFYSDAKEKSARFNNGVQSGGQLSYVLFEYKKHEIGWLTGMGYQRRRWGVDLRFDRSSGISPYLGLGAAINTVSLLTLYYFNR